MKRVLSGMVLGALMCGAGFAYAGKVGHPNIQAARKACNNSISALNRAQNANEFDLDGHAANAKKLMEQALVDIDAALGTARSDTTKKAAGQ